MDKAGILPPFSHKEDNVCDFLFAFLHTTPFLEEDLLYKERTVHCGSNFFPYRADPF